MALAVDPFFFFFDPILKPCHPLSRGRNLFTNKAVPIALRKLRLSLLNKRHCLCSPPLPTSPLLIHSKLFRFPFGSSAFRSLSILLPHASHHFSHSGSDSL